MTVQEVIDELMKIKDKSKELEVMRDFVCHEINYVDGNPEEGYYILADRD